MTMPTLEPYLHYKSSGVEWIDRSPAHWELRKLRGAVRPITARNRPDLPLLSVVREKGVILRDVTDYSENHNFIPDDLTNYKVVKAGQFAMNKMKAWQGSYGVSQYDGIVSPAYFVFDIHGVQSDFFNVAIRSQAYVPFFGQASDGVRIGQWDLSQERMREIVFLVPPASEQSAIVRYLDHVDSHVRRYISAKERLIELLTEQRQAVINQAVTRGLDPNARLKPSGVEWLGDIPDHWDVLRSRFLFNEVNLRSTTGEEVHLSMSQVLGLVPSHLVKQTLIAESYIGGKLCQKGDLVLNRLKAHLGVFALANKGGVVSADYSVFRQRQSSVDMEYFEQVLRSPSFRTELRIRSKGIVEGFWRLYTDDFFDIRLPVPPASEQRRIVEVLRVRTATIDSSIDRARRQIELMREYRTRLIADVVTGKLDVRETVADEVPTP